MLLSELFNKLKETNYDVAYHHFKTEPTFPFIAYYENERTYKKSDNINYFESMNITVELYTENANDDQLNVVKDALKEFPFELEPFVYIKDEDMYMSVFTFSI